MRITARARWFTLNSLNRSRMRSRHGGLRALPTCGRSIVITATLPWYSSRTSSSIERAGSSALDIRGIYRSGCAAVASHVAIVGRRACVPVDHSAQMAALGPSGLPGQGRQGEGHRGRASRLPGRRLPRCRQDHLRPHRGAPLARRGSAVRSSSWCRPGISSCSGRRRPSGSGSISSPTGRAASPSVPSDMHGIVVTYAQVATSARLLRTLERGRDRDPRRDPPRRRRQDVG